jgi:hypothetical protein
MSVGCTPFLRLLSARIDGALDGAHACQLEEHLAACGSCRARERSLLAQGAALRAGSLRRLEQLEESGAIDLSDFAARVLGAAARDRRATRWERLKLSLRERWEHQRLAFSASVGLVAASCAALVLLLAARHPAVTGGPLLAEQDPANPLAAQASIDDLEFLTGTAGAVFQVPGQTTVIWLADEVAE